MSIVPIIQALWEDVQKHPKLKVFALQDGAASPRVHANLTQSGTDSACLYSPYSPPSLVRAAPHLVHLRLALPYTRWYVGASLGQSWGVYLQSESSLMALRNHFQKLLKVQNAMGQTMLFRFFDPRILRVYLPTCNTYEAKTFFGPVERFFVEDKDGKNLIVYTCEAGKVVAQTLAMARSEREAASVS